ncbi:MAG: FKBP-type peptidyl-prolyl cis-trans isomerase [Mycetocola sp.]
MRTSLPVLVAAAAASTLVLVGCASPEPAPSGTTEPAALSCEDTPGGSAVDSVTVTGDFGAAPAVDFPEPLKVDATQRAVVIEGDGDEVKPGDMVNFDVSIFNGTSGAMVSQTAYSGGGWGAIEVNDTKFIPGLVRTLECVNEGSRVVSVVPAEDGFGDTGSPDGAVAPGDPLVIVADAVGIVPSTATGEPQPPVEGMPTVKLDSDGAPTVTIPDTDAPAELKLATLKQGTGELVQEGDSVTVQYQGVNWRTGEVFDQSWGKGAATFPTTGVVPGFSAALVGAAVGSQVLAVLPPSEGYGEAGQPSAGIEGTDTLVFVVDVLSTSR